MWGVTEFHVGYMKGTSAKSEGGILEKSEKRNFANRVCEMKYAVSWTIVTCE